MGTTRNRVAWVLCIALAGAFSMSSYRPVTVDGFPQEPRELRLPSQLLTSAAAGDWTLTIEILTPSAVNEPSKLAKELEKIVSEVRTGALLPGSAFV